MVNGNNKNKANKKTSTRAKMPSCNSDTSYKIDAVKKCPFVQKCPFVNIWHLPIKIRYNITHAYGKQACHTVIENASVYISAISLNYIKSNPFLSNSNVFIGTKNLLV